MSDTASQKPGSKAKGLGRGLGSLLSPTGEGAFSRNTPNGEVALEALTTGLPSQTQPAIREGFVESPPPPPQTQPQPTVPPQARIWNLPVEKLNPNPNQPRQIFDKEPLMELANSIKERGVIQPLLVRKTANDEYEIIAGERRWRAAQIAGLREVPVLIKDSNEQEVLELALIENIQRQDLNPIEEAEAYDFLLKKYNFTQNDLAQRVGKERVTIANMLRLLQLQPAVRQMVSRGDLSMGLAKVLLSVPDAKLQQDLAIKAKGGSLTVRALERMIANRESLEARGAALPTDARLQAAATVREELQKLIGSKVELDYDSGKGKLVIHFYSDAELNQIVDTLRDSWRK